jgi:hypothetical protein
MKCGGRLVIVIRRSVDGFFLENVRVGLCSIFDEGWVQDGS